MKIKTKRSIRPVMPNGSPVPTVVALPAPSRVPEVAAPTSADVPEQEKTKPAAESKSAGLEYRKATSWSQVDGGWWQRALRPGEPHFERPKEETSLIILATGPGGYMRVYVSAGSVCALSLSAAAEFDNGKIR